jgi:uncharacterized membrane protein YgdD (TMEM256/DUF423 family)
MSRAPNFVALAAVLAALGVALGAFGAHGLQRVASREELGLWETATRYWLVEALGLFGFGLFRLLRPGSALPGWLMLAGALVFSGTLYAMALGGPRWLGAVTPFGGLFIIAGWLTLAFSARQNG